VCGAQRRPTLSIESDPNTEHTNHQVDEDRVGHDGELQQPSVAQQLSQSIKPNSTTPMAITYAGIKSWCSHILAKIAEHTEANFAFWEKESPEKCTSRSLAVLRHAPPGWTKTNRIATLGLWICITLVVLATFVQHRHRSTMAARKWTVPGGSPSVPISYFIHVNEALSPDPYGFNDTGSYHVLKEGTTTSIVYNFIASDTGAWDNQQLVLQLGQESDPGPDPWSGFFQVIRINYGESWECVADFSSEQIPTPHFNCDDRLLVQLTAYTVVLDFVIPNPFYGLPASEHLQVKLSMVSAVSLEAFSLAPYVHVRLTGGSSVPITPLNGKIYFFDKADDQHVPNPDMSISYYPNLSGGAGLPAFSFHITSPSYTGSTWSIFFPPSFEIVSIPSNCNVPSHAILLTDLNVITCAGGPTQDVKFRRVDYTIVTESFSFALHPENSPIPDSSLLIMGLIS